MDIFQDYQSWLNENDYFFSLLKKNNSIILNENSHIFLVLNYLQQNSIKEKELDYFEADFFHTGFYYLYDHFNYLKLIYESTLNSNIQDFIYLEKTILLLLYTLDFENDLSDEENKLSASIKKKGLQELRDLQENILSFIAKKENAPRQIHNQLDEISLRAYANKDYISTSEIFYQIALEYQLTD